MNNTAKKKKLQYEDWEKYLQIWYLEKKASSLNKKTSLNSTVIELN